MFQRELIIKFSGFPKSNFNLLDMEVNLNALKNLLENIVNTCEVKINIEMIDHFLSKRCEILKYTGSPLQV
jgi:oligoribonuclease NrnB/cAMP/cGMP phosphodiesterase (DHH superfamily)